MLLSCGVIGCGQIARDVHLRVLRTLPGARVVALAERDPQALQAAQLLAPDARAYADADELLADASVQCVLICLPNALHAPISIRAFEAGKHVYLEKPLALSPSEGRKVVEAQQNAGTVGALGFNYRFNPLHVATRQALQEKRIGAVMAIRSSFCAPIAPPPQWKRTSATGGGVLFDLASHHLDLLRYLTGREVVWAWASTRSVRFEADTATIELTLDDETLVQGFFSQSAAERDVWEFEGEGGRIRVDRYTMSEIEMTRPGEIGLGARLRRNSKALHPRVTAHGARHTLRKLRAPNHEPSYRVGLSHFVRAVAENRPELVPSLQDGLRNLEILAALQRSSQERCRVEVTQ